MKNSLSIALMQSEIKWHDPVINFETTKVSITQLSEVDIVVLPEMWSSGFTMHAHKYHQYTEQAIDLMRQWSLDLNACVIGSLITKVNDHYYNRLYAIDGGEVIATYDKKHLFGHSGEDRFFEPGNKKSLIDYKGWKICLNICYDLRFPVWCRNTEDYDILLFCANWPDKRISAWDTLLRARAVENQCYVVGTNCYGKDVWDNTYAGHSAIVDYSGGVIGSLIGESGIVSGIIKKDDLNDFRQKLPFLKDRDQFMLKD